MTPQAPLLLTDEALGRARDWVQQHARPLERARFAQVVDGGSTQAVADALAAFGNTDGGFGRALEPDCRAPEASVLATLTALDVAYEHGLPGDHAIVARACDWLVAHAEQDDAGRWVWPFLPLSAQASPHAPWWEQSEPGQLAAMFDGFVANPGVAITAHLWRREAAAPGSVPSELLTAITEQAAHVARAGVADDDVNAHDALAHFAGETAAPASVRAAIVGYLESVLPERVMRASADFAQYGIHPLWIAPDPGHPLADALAGPLALALDHTIASQQPDGSWAPFWSWGTGAPEWELARQEWSGTLVVRNVHALLRHGRVAGRDAPLAG